jgi:pimeloyl-ACP methyl ester carboxylesterase
MTRIASKLARGLTPVVVGSVVVGSVAALLVGLLAPAAGASASPVVRSGLAVATRPGRPNIPVLKWRPCAGSFQCATARVPLDYAHPHGTLISIAVMRHLATDPARRVGSLFINGGGPSEQLQSFPGAYPGIPAALKARYDIVDFDPRGFGYSTAVRCFPTAAAESKFLGPLPPFPVGHQQEEAWERAWARFDAVCAAHANAGLLAHDTTADVARDMNLLRQAAGDPVLNYVGLSYGSALGATYANLFPSTVGNMVLDGNVNPVTWSTSTDGLPVFLRLHSDQASAENMTALLDLCAKAPASACAFSAGTPAATRAKFSVLLRRLLRHPVTVDKQYYTYAIAIASMGLGQVSQWQSSATLLQQLWKASAGSSAAPGAPAGQAAPAGRAAPTAPAAQAGLPAVYGGQEQNLAVLCSDTANPRDAAAYPVAAQLAYRRSGAFGLNWTWPTAACASWPRGAARDRYTGPWNRRTANTILLLGNTHDAALPYVDSLAMEHDLARARLLTINGYGHTEESNPSACAIRYEVRYLLTGALPLPGTVCQQSVKPF